MIDSLRITMVYLWKITNYCRYHRKYEWDINGILMILFLPRKIRWRNQDYHDCHDYMYDYNILEQSQWCLYVPVKTVNDHRWVHPFIGINLQSSKGNPLLWESMGSMVFLVPEANPRYTDDSGAVRSREYIHILNRTLGQQSQGATEKINII